MVKKKLVLSFPPRLIQQPVTSDLIRQFDLEVNILRARVVPRESGRIVMQLKGSAKSIKAGLDYLEEQGVQVDPMVQEMRHYGENCVQCTACTAVCPTDALTVEPVSREIVFEPSHCIMCESCIAACSYGAMESQF
ncbi:MAG: 4Fe-4S dicluster domain-containing protein [Desulfarculaceae bacterium]|nr:4Fe-4S dicluster domain-containing protein [Desulfarculaceae bacterium]MCF8046877.1 4Fe-4S dicluster domain-containing protein [Desulfarculaceae bacterium]MCF8066173.1 4Fe-4S dicluster domain-containing protein [Desulfarculaceae bacterium]MCF8098955.1 4Fe-4S dicluster domain-containing protein [Desulfarculaceae bacterium]MCF8121356.1 4Fe-4S dicluster domain-containing protein [Desulfarculaceae bacterium]